ncbi:hypothetical protein EYZ11_002218 [Aspergillus tanneri]|uniref:Endoplasmic reticulum transmembrane protein n=1 Tax=Aspergillus tanneri TaxID=1220188 RepID=A0A4S3JRQ4_9EURO|nr:hypothetical protein EYZ11_002218 [Aspergillus tanneri]
MAVFMGLILPLPFTVKRKLFTFISESPVVAKLQYGLKLELASFHKEGGGMAAAALGTDRMEIQARKFYSQRNMYLCGFTLFLSLILNRTYTMILEVLRLEEKVKLLESEKKSGAKQAVEAGEVARLKKQLEGKDRDLETLKKQCEGLTREYHSLGDKVAGEKDATSKKDL